jgi:hypothetical protein
MKKALKFTLPLLPVALVAGYFVTGYQLETLDPTMLEEALAQIGGTGVLTLVSMLQTLGYTLFCGVLGHILAQKVGLVKTVRFEKKPLLLTLGLSLVFGVIFSLDYWTFGAVMPELRAGLDQITVNNWVASILYGGIVEELMLRLFFMSLIAWILQKLLKKQTTGILIAANVIAAILFAASHLPATWMAFGELTPMLLFRCFLLNGGFGLFFGWAYRKYGIQYAMAAHASLHIVSKLIWTIFI